MDSSGKESLVGCVDEWMVSGQPATIPLEDRGGHIEIVLIGDSIRMGYQEVVRAELKGMADIWAPEENGGDSTNVLKHLKDWVFSRSPSIVHLNCGLHDIKKPFDSGEAAVPTEKYEANMREIFRQLSAESAAQVIWATTTPVNEERHHANKGFDRFEADVGERNKTATAIAEEFGVPVDDLFEAVMAAGRDRLLTEDGVHFTEEGCAVLGQAVADFLKPFLINLWPTLE